MNKFQKILESGPVEASAPCRIDMGGTLDLPTFYYPLHRRHPCTFNIALDLRTRVRLRPFARGRVQVASRGFATADYLLEEAPFNHPLGLMFAVAAFFGAAGVRIEIESASPPRGALGGSSAAAVALGAAMSRLTALCGRGPAYNRRQAALVALEVEQSVAGVPCGLQDHLAAAYGGINAWYWQPGTGSMFRRKSMASRVQAADLQGSLLVAYCGRPHSSSDVNGRWVRQFLAGKHRSLWLEIVDCTHRFLEAFERRDFSGAGKEMNRETGLRSEMTPEVLDELGRRLVEDARRCGCGARFTGAGAGGCLWALGESESIDKLRPLWEESLASRPGAGLLEAGIDFRGLA